MKTKSVIKALSRFGFLVDEKGHHYFWTRDDRFSNRQIQVIDQGGNAIALPLFVEKDGEKRVVFCANTIKSLVEFLKGAA